MNEQIFLSGGVHAESSTRWASPFALGVDDFRTLFELSPVAVYAIDAAGVVKQFNRHAAELWGRTPKSGDTDEVFCGSHRLYLPDGTFLAHRDCPMATVVHGDIAEVHDTEVVIERPDGSRISVIVNIKPLKNENGEIVGAINCFYDITERKRLELKAHKQAEALIDLHTRKDEFLAMLSHELRGPLAPIFSAIQLLQRRQPDQAQQARLYGIIENQSRQLKHLVDDLMDVSRITHGKVSLQLCQTSLASIIERAIDTASPLIEMKHHGLEVAVATEPMNLHADPGRLEQVVVNLLANAAKYTQDGGRISLRAYPQGEHAVLRVTDSGVGIAAALLPHIFDLFSQAEPSIARTQGGLGIGLWLVKRVVEMHAGSVSVTSELGHGSEFTVRLPLSTGTHPSEVCVDLEPPREAGHRVLVVDDNVDAARVLGALFEASGFQVQFAHDGAVALKMASDFSPHIVLLDIGLPGLDGYEVTRAIRANLALEQPTIVAITGYSQDVDRYRSKEAGFDYHLVKPVDFDQLMALVCEFNLPALAPLVGRRH